MLVSRSNPVAIVVALALLAGLLYVGSPRPSRQARPAYLAPPQYLRHLTFGYGENFADGLWLRTIQDCDMCEQARAADPGGENTGLIDPFVGSARRAAARCDQGWVYRMLDSASELAPRFRILYSLGAVMLSIMVDDREGARLLFEKGIRNFPNDWGLAYRAAYHYMYEIGDLGRAGDLLLNAARNGAPPWTFSLAAKIRTETGQAMLAKPIIEEALQRSPSEAMAKRLRARLDRVNAILAAQKQ